MNEIIKKYKEIVGAVAPIIVERNKFMVRLNKRCYLFYDRNCTSNCAHFSYKLRKQPVDSGNEWCEVIRCKINKAVLYDKPLPMDEIEQLVKTQP